MKRLECPACKGQVLRSEFTISGYLIIRCLNCGSLFVQNLPPDNVLDAIYQNAKYYSSLDEIAIFRHQQENRRRVSQLLQLGGSGRLLDVGCATGLFLETAKQNGFTTYGIEPNKNNAKKAIEKGHSIFEGSLETFCKLQRSQKPFDVVVALDVIEHMPDPEKFMKLLDWCLRPDGILVVTTPNFSGVVSQFLKVRDPFLTPPEHLNFFTSKGLIILAEKCGLKYIKKLTFGKLTAPELDRSVTKYFPKSFISLGGVIKPFIRLGFRLANRFRLGLELEYYFTKKNISK